MLRNSGRWLARTGTRSQRQRCVWRADQLLPRETLSPCPGRASRNLPKAVKDGGGCSCVRGGRASCWVEETHNSALLLLRGTVM